jgi:hypothetical protein
VLVTYRVPPGERQCSTHRCVRVLTDYADDRPRVYQLARPYALDAAGHLCVHGVPATFDRMDARVTCATCGRQLPVEVEVVPHAE